MRRRWIGGRVAARVATMLVLLAAALGAAVPGSAAGATPVPLPPQPAPAPGREPVVLVPGWLGWPESMNVLATVFRTAGYPTYVVNQNKLLLWDLVGVPSTDTFMNGPRLAAVIEQARRETGAERVNLVAYSYGGLVARHYVKDMGQAAKVRRYVGIGVPQRGVAPACGLPYTETGHLCPASAFIRALNRGDDTPDGIVYTNIWSDQDGMRNVAVDGSVCVRHVPNVAHLSEPFDLTIAAEALARVRNDRCPPADEFVGTVPDAQGP